MNKIGIVRVSTKKQENGSSLIEQENIIKNYAGNDIEIISFTQSGYNKSIFKKITPLIKNNTEIIICYADRLSRNINDTLTFFSNVLIPNNAYIYSINENINTKTETGQIDFYKKILDGQSLSANISKRVKASFKYKIKRERYGNNIYEKNIIKQIIYQYNLYKKIIKVVEFLNINKIKRKENDIDDTFWTKGKVNYIIKNNKKNQNDLDSVFDFSKMLNELNDIDYIEPIVLISD
jgi:DNA invertase Pin-like site-specific DNA recombinase